MDPERIKRTFEILTVFKLCNHIPKKVLDYGFGDGQITNFLHQKGYNIIGLDITKRNFEKAKKHFPECDYRWYDGSTIPFEKNSFDTLIMNDVFEHVPYARMEELIEELKEVIEPNGLMYISATNRYELVEPHTYVPFLTWFPRIFWNTLDQKLNKKGDYHISDIHPYTLRRIKKFCKIHSLQFKNFTYIYTLHKFADLEYIGNRVIRSLVKFLKKLKMLNIFFYLAYKFSVFIFICRVEK